MGCRSRRDDREKGQAVTLPLVDLRRLVERILTRHDLLSGAQSPLGHDLEIAWTYQDCVRRQGVLERAGLAWQRIDRADARHMEFAYLTALAGLWTDEEEAVLRAKCTPATPAELASRTPPETGERERIAWRSDVRPRHYVDDHGNPQVSHETTAGEQVVHDCQGDANRCGRDPLPALSEWLRLSDADGRYCMRDSARVIVRGMVPRSPTAREVAERLRLSVDQVKRRTTSAYTKLRDELERRAMQGMRHAD